MTTELSALALTVTEKLMLDLLLLEQPRTVAKDDLVMRSGGGKPKKFYKSNSVDVHIKNLRKKLAGTRYSIRTVRGIGYQLVLAE